MSAVGVSAPAPAELALEMVDVSKAYGAVQALRGVSLRAPAGTIHAVLGENGAGKSTLLEVLAGNVVPDAGEIRIAGRPSAPWTVHDTQWSGVRVVHQELSLSPTVTVAENLLVGRFPLRWGLVSQRQLNRRAREVLARFDVDVDPRATTGELPIGLQQQVEIARALSGEATVLALDEPTSSLSVHESRALFDQLKQLRARGRTIVIVTHRIDDALSLADGGTVLRDGALVGEFESAQTSEPEIVAMMIGRQLTSVFPERRPPAPAAEVVLEVEGVASAPVVKDATLQVRSGEIVGLYGLVGSGRSELAQTLFGLRPRDAGTVRIGAKALRRGHSPRAAMAAGMAFLPEDRKTEGLFMLRSIAENVCAPRLREFGRVMLSAREMRVRAREALAGLAVAKPPEEAVGNLSGGNQQKVLFARARSLSPAILVVDEPTRGVDVGSKAAIHQALRGFADTGAGVLLISSEMPEVLGMSDRVYVMGGGRVVDECTPEEATEERLMLASSLGRRDTEATGHDG